MKPISPKYLNKKEINMTTTGPNKAGAQMKQANQAI
jgi:hypothetical protein